MACVTLDLFAGGGGFALGIKNAGFSVVGVDINPNTEKIFAINNIGKTIITDLLQETVHVDAPLVVGGPPYQPWALSNVKIKYKEHPLRPLLNRFFEHIIEIKPEIFIMENVPRIQIDGLFWELINNIKNEGYSVQQKIIQYCDFGVASARKRIFVVGVRNSLFGAVDFLNRLERFKQEPMTVKDAIYWLRDMQRGEYNAHEWMVSKIIYPNNKRFTERKFGSTKLDYNKQAPSCGSIAKTYVLHPEAFENNNLNRVISVREALCIIGFPKDYMIPEELSLSEKYQIAANAVSPKFALACGKVAMEMITETLV